ncbi:MAG: hypothetical protein VX000_16070, partial [Myxococcota bacterium]|nr:hypothetical protein [Myxococcota bacterium]
SVVGGVVELANGNTVNHMTARIREVVGIESPEVVWELVVGRPGETTEPGATVYRAERIESLSPAW